MTKRGSPCSRIRNGGRFIDTRGLLHALFAGRDENQERKWAEQFGRRPPPPAKPRSFIAAPMRERIKHGPREQ